MIKNHTCGECKHWFLYDERRLLGDCPRGRGVACERVSCEAFEAREDIDDEITKCDRCGCDVDLCEDCTNKFKAWMNPEVTIKNDN